MSDPGRGRGLALLQKLKSRQQSSPDASQASSETSAPAPSPAPSLPPSHVTSDMSIPSGLGGRGRASLMLSMMQGQRPGGPITASAPVSEPSTSAASHAASTTSPTAVLAQPRSAGRGLALFQHLKKQQVSPAQQSVTAAGDDVESVASKLQSSVISEATTASTLRAKNKDIREVKETPPVVKTGETGRPCDLSANFIRLSVEPGRGVFEYEVRYEPIQDMKGHRIKLLNMHLDVIGRTKTFDGTTLYLPKELSQEVTVLTSMHPIDNTPVKVKIIYRRQRRMGEVVHLYNVLFKNIMKELELVRFGRRFFDPSGATAIPQHKLEVWPGYVTAVDEYEGGLMLTLDSEHRVLRTQSVHNYIRELANQDRVHWKDNVTQALLGSSVMTTYSKTLYRVDDIDMSKNPLSTFTERDGSEISFVQYYKKAYDIDIVDVDQPLLISKMKRMKRSANGDSVKEDVMVNLVPELCQLTGLSEQMRTNFRLMKDVAAITRITPNQRLYAFKQFLSNMSKNDNCHNLLANWGLKIDTDTVRLTGRILPPEKLTFGNGKVVQGSPNAEWSREATNNQLMETVNIMNWAVLHTRKDTNCTQDFVETLKRCGPPMGIRVKDPQCIVLQSDSNSAYSSSLNSVINESLQLVVLVCPTSRDDRYAVIKRLCNCIRPIPSQVINARTIMNRDKMRSVVQKIALQINCKLGGTLWGVSIPFKNAMVIGIDSYHEVARKNKSVCGFVASYNALCTHWYSRVVQQATGQEILDGLKSCLCDALRYYHSVNNTFPDKVIIYRDGVGDGQLRELQEYEIPQFNACFEMVKSDYSPTLTFVVVQKRINTRLFMWSNGHQPENPPPGTVLDHTITRRDWYDFLIVPQKVGQGTVTPSHYIVLHDSSTMTPDHVQRLTYKMCHLYYNWPGTVRVPAPCQYAHKLAFLVGQSMKEHHSMKLSDRLFFL